MKKTNLTYVKKSYGVNPKQKFVKCVLDYEINLDKIPGIQTLACMPEFEDFINTLVYDAKVPCYDTDMDGFPSAHGVLVFRSEGIAQCSPADEFDAELGKKLALTRAQRQAFGDASAFYDALTEIIHNEFDGLYGLMFGCMNSRHNCAVHEHELTGHTAYFEGQNPVKD